MHIPSMNLIDRARRGDLNFEKLVQILQQAGYITEKNQESGCGFGRSAMEATKQEDFEKLFDFFFPAEICDVEVDCVATDKGGQAGAYAYALFNKNEISRNEMLRILELQNKRHNSAPL